MPDVQLGIQMVTYREEEEGEDVEYNGGSGI